MGKRAFVIVLDSFGVGELPDASIFGDCGSNTALSVASSPVFDSPVLSRSGIFNLPTMGELRRCSDPWAAYGYAAEKSAGKDTTVGHWELAGLISSEPFPVYPKGFPNEIIENFQKQTGRRVICNLPYSGTDVIRDYGAEHLKTGALIVYTSADSVFQIAAHTDIVPLELLYSYCRIARNITKVARVIARPFSGPENEWQRTPDRRDFSLPPPSKTMPDCITDAGLQSIAVGKTAAIFCNRGFSKAYVTHGNSAGIQTLKSLVKQRFSGLCFVNLVDFDMLYGHRNDIDGYARAVNEFDPCLSYLKDNASPDDLFIVTADHGCDPGTPSTDHSREYIPIIAFGAGLEKGRFLGCLDTFADVSATVCDFLGVPSTGVGTSFL